jgi:dUTP pyrophosphatase
MNLENLYYFLGLGYEYLLEDSNVFYIKVKNCDKDLINKIKYWSFKIDKIVSLDKYTYFYSFDNELNNYMYSIKNSFFTNDLNLKYLLHFFRGFVEINSSYTYKVKNIPPILKFKVKSEHSCILNILKSKFSNEEIWKEDKYSILVMNYYETSDFLEKLYGDIINNKFFFCKRLYNYYNYTREYHNDKDCIRYCKNLENAVDLYKKNSTDSGYDLTIIKKIKQVGQIEFYDTGISVKPPSGYYFDLIPRSSLSKSGYILANSVGIIDKTYTGNIIVPLIKIDKTFPDIEIPSRVVQLIPRRIIHFDVLETKEIQKTIRGTNGFGSSGKN